jgi:hypothetical protein
MRQFIVTSKASNRLGLRELCEQLANDLWVPTHLTETQVATFALDQFQRTSLAELEMIEVSGVDECQDHATE